MKFSLIENKYILSPPDDKMAVLHAYGINCFKFKVAIEKKNSVTTTMNILVHLSLSLFVFSREIL